MRPSPMRPPRLLLVLLLAASSRSPADDGPLRDALRHAQRDAVDAAAALGRDSAAEAVASLELAIGSIDSVGTARVVVRRLTAARDAAAAVVPGGDVTDAVLRVRRAATAIRTALRRGARSSACEVLESDGAHAAVHLPGHRAVIVVRGAAPGADADLT